MAKLLMTIFFGIVTQASSADNKGVPSWVVELDNSYVQLGAGQIERSKSSTLNALNFATNPIDQLFVLGRLYELCIRIFDYNCSQETFVRYTALAAPIWKDSTKPKEFRDEVYTRGLVQLIRLQLLGGHFDDANNTGALLEDLLRQIPVMEGELWVTAYLALSKLKIQLRNFDSARHYSDLAWIRFLSNPNWDPRQKIKFAAAFTDTFGQLGQARRAASISRISDDFVMKQGRLHKFDSIQYLITSVATKTREGDLGGAVNLSAIALSLIAETDLPGIIKTAALTDLHTGILSACAINPSVLACKDLRTDSKNHIENLVGQRGDLNPASYGALIALVLNRLANSERVEEWQADLLDRTPENITTRFESISTGSLKDFAHSLRAIHYKDPGQARKQIISAAKSEMAGLHQFKAISSLEMPLPSAYQIYIFSLAAQALRHNIDRTDDENNILFQINDFASRSARRIESDYMLWKSRLPEDPQRQALQAYQRLKQDWALLERRRLAELLNKTPEIKSQSRNETNFDSSLFLRYRSFKSETSRYEKVISGETLEGRALTTNLGDLQKTLEDGEAYLTYHVSFGQIMLMCVRRSGVFVASPALPSSLGVDIKLIGAALTNPSPPNKSDASFPIAQALRLSNVLLMPVKDCLIGADTIIFRSDDSLPGISWHALIDPLSKDYQQSNDLELHKIPWLGARYSVATAAGASQLIASRSAGASSATKAFFGVGDPILSGLTDDGIVRREAISRGGSSLSRGLRELEELPETAIELRTWVELFPEQPRMLLRQDATEANVRAEVLKSYSVLSFATHGLVKEEIPGLTEPALVLTPIRADRQSDDGLLTATDISRLDLDANLVVLSACNSANIQIDLFAPEAASLSSAFFLAGARATLASLWSVNSEATAILMQEFSRNFSKAERSAGASLRLSIQQLLEQSTHEAFRNPRFWASFMLYGDPSVQSKLINKREFSIDIGAANSDGHIQQAVRSGEKALLVGAAPSEAESHYVGFATLVNRSGHPLWTFSTGRHFFSTPNETGENGEIYLVTQPADVDSPEHLNLFELNKEGSVVSKEVIPRAIGEHVLRPILLRGGRLIAIPNFDITGTRNSIRLTLFDLTKRSIEREVTIKSNIKSSIHNNVPIISENRREASFSIIFGASVEPSQNQVLDNYGSFQPCIAEKISEIIRLDQSFQIIGTTLTPRNIYITDSAVTEAGRQIYAYTKIANDCTLTVESSGIAEPSSDGVLRYTEQPLSGYAAKEGRIKLLSDGRLLIYSAVHRRFEDSSLLVKSWGGATTTDIFSSSSTDEQIGLGLTVLDPEMKTGRSKIIFNGSNLFSNDLIDWGDGEISIYGELANKKLIAKFLP